MLSCRSHFFLFEKYEAIRLLGYKGMKDGEVTVPLIDLFLVKSTERPFKKASLLNEQPRGLPRGMECTLLLVSDRRVGEFNHFKIKSKNDINPVEDRKESMQSLLHCRNIV